MKELVTQSQAEIALRGIALVTPIIGVVTGAIVGAIRKRIARDAARGFLIGLAGTAVFGLWKVYNLIGHRFGYTSVASLLVQLALFSGIGIGVGFAISRATKSPREADSSNNRRISSQGETLNAS